MSPFKLLVVVVLLAVGILVAACEKLEVQAPDGAGARIAFTQVDAREARTAFAKTLAKALVRKELRDFFKNEALKQFDEDYDVFFHAQKNKIVTGKTTLLDLLASYHGDRQDFVNITQSLPTLTVLVPELFNTKFYNSALTWDTENFVPKVAAFGPELEKEKNGVVAVYDSKGKKYEMPTKGDPDELILVVKDNERIEVVRGSARMTSQSAGEFFMADGDNQYYFGSPNYNRAKRRGGRVGATTGVGTDLGVGGQSAPEFRSHFFRPECPRSYAYYKSYYSGGQIVYNTGELFPGQFDYTIKDRISFVQFNNMTRVQIISDNWSEGNLEFVFRVVVGGRTGPIFQEPINTGFSIPRFAAQLTVPGFADAVEAGFGQICVPKFPFGCRTVNPLRDAFYAMRDDGTLYDNRGASVNGGVWISRNADIVNWNPDTYGNLIKIIAKEKDSGAEITQVVNHSVGINATIGPKDGSNVGFNSTVSGTVTIKWTDGDDDLFSQDISYCQPYGAFQPASIDAGDTKVILRIY